MAISDSTTRKLRSLVGKREGEDIAAQIASGGNPQAANVAALGTTDNIAGASTTVSTGGTPDCDAADIQTGVDSAIDTVAAEIETRLDNIEAKVDALIAALVASGQMASS